MTPRDAEALAAEVDRLNLKVGEFREALEKIAKIPEWWDKGYVEKDHDLNFAIDTARKAIAEKAKCEQTPEHPFTEEELKALQDSPCRGISTEKRVEDGLKLGESRNLPYPKPIRDGDAKSGKPGGAQDT